MQRAQFFRRAANVQNAVVGRRAERVLLRKLEYPAGEKVAGLYEAIPEVSSPGHVRFAARHGCRKGKKLVQLRFQAEDLPFYFPGIAPPPPLFKKGFVPQVALLTNHCT